MEKKQLKKLEIEAFKTVEKPPRLRWERKNGNGPNRANKAVQDRWRSVTGKISDTARKARNTTRNGNEGDGAKEDDAGYRKLLIKTGVCAAIAVAILVISSINAPVVNDITDAIDTAVNHQFDIEEDIGRLKFVQNLGEEVQSVFSPTPESAVVFPTDGNVLTNFGEGGSKGVRIEPDQTEVVCIAKGTVTTVGAIDGKGFVKVDLDSGQTVVFHNISPVVMVDDIVLPGQPIGDVAGDYLYIEMKDGEEYIDPIVFVQQRAAMVLE